MMVGVLDDHVHFLLRRNVQKLTGNGDCRRIGLSFLEIQPQQQHGTVKNHGDQLCFLHACGFDGELFDAMYFRHVVLQHQILPYFFSNEVFNVRKARMAIEALDLCETIQEKEKADHFFLEIPSLKL